jgi:hypothetical protein
MQAVLRTIQVACRAGRRVWPYLMLELLMPGGSLMALLLFLHRRRKLVPLPTRCRNGNVSIDYRMSALPIAFLRSKP